MALQVFAADAGEAMTQVAATQEFIYYLADDRTPEAMLFGKATVVNTLILINVVFVQPIRR